jgi:two-component system, cell cycle response regulator
MAGKKLLVADDSLTIQKVIRLALSNEGYDIQAVSDGNDAIQQISIFRPDLILIDVSLPGQSAFEVKKAVNQEEDLAGTRFILMSSAFEKIDEALAKEVTFQGRLTKPFDPAHLRQVLIDVMSAPMPARPAPPPSSQQHVREVTGEHFAPPPPPPSDDGSMLHEEELPPLPDSAPPPNWDPVSTPPENTASEIRQLTESTIRMSHLDEYEWSVNEPSLKPLSGHFDSGTNSGFVPPPPPASLGARTMAPPPPIDLPPMAFGSSSDSEPALPPPSESENPFPDFEIETQPPSEMEMPKSDSMMMPPLPSTPVTPHLVEELVQKQVEEVLEKMAKKMLPDIAERLIKEQIHKMLSEI